MLVYRIKSMARNVLVKKRSTLIIMLILISVVLFSTIAAKTMAFSHDKNNYGTSSEGKIGVESEKTYQPNDEVQKIADALSCILHQMMNTEYAELPEIFSFENTLVNATIVEGYIWHETDRPNEQLLKIAPEGITCILQVPVAIQNRPSIYVINLGREAEGTYNSDIYSIYPIWTNSVEQFVEDHISGNQLSQDYKKVFEFYVPLR